MTITRSRQLAFMTVGAVVALGAGTVITRADVPGYLFMDIDNNHAMVVNAPRDQGPARISKEPTNLPDDIAAAIAADGKPIGPNHIILAYHGQLYILPDKDLGAGKMASHMVMNAAAHASN